MTEEVLQLHRDMAKDLRTAKVIAFDTESEDFLATPYRVSFATEKGFYSCGIGMKNYHGFGFVVKDSFVKEILSRSDVKIIMHNAKYDKKTVKLWLDIDIHDFEDTMLIAHLLNENERKGLKDVAQRYLGVKNWDVSKATKQGKALIQNSVEILPDVKPKVKLKNKIKKIAAELSEFSEEECCPYLVKQYNDLLYKLNCSDEEWQELVEKSKKEHEDETKKLLTNVWEQEVNYSALDAKYTLDLWNMLYPIIKEEQLQFVYEKIEKPLVNVLVDMELNGVPIDLELLKEIEVESKQEMKELEIKLRETFGDINFASPKQLSKAIFEDAGIDPIEPRSAKTGEYSTRAEILNILAKEHEPVKWILRHRELSKLVSTYMYGVDRLHSDFNQVATTTGRFSSSNPNLQQLPRSGKIRKCFIPEKGDKLIVCDLCIAEGTKVYTERGLVNIEEIVVGDKVFDESGELYNVEKAVFSGSKECVKLVTDIGYSVVSTREHRVKTIDHRGEYIWKQVGEISIGERVVASGRKINPEVLISMPPLTDIVKPSNKTKDFKVPAFLCEDFAELLGMILGDGLFCERSIGVIVCDEDRDLQEHVKNQLAHLFKASVHVYADKGATRYLVHRKGLCKYLNYIGVYKYNIPDIMFMASESIKGAFLRGLFESDGSISKGVSGVASFSSKSREMVEKVQILLLSLGIHSRLRIVSHSKGYAYYLVIRKQFLSRFKDSVGFISKRKSDKLSERCGEKLCSNEYAYQYPYIEQFSDRDNAAFNKLKNQRNLKRNVSFSLANTIKEIYPYNELKSLKDYAENNVIFPEVISIEDVGVKNTYDLQVHGSNQFISNGIVTHNSQVELRLTAFYSKDKEMLKCYAEDIDIHSRTAIASFNLKCSVDEVKKKYPEQRTYAKIVNFGLIYGMSPRTLSEALKVPLDVAQKAYNGYFRTYSGVKPFMESVKGVGKRRGYVKSFSGRRRRCKELYEAARFPSMVTADMHRTLAYQEREVANFVIQGTGADIMKMAMVNMYPELKKLGAKMLMTIHDEIVVSCPEDKVEEGARIIKYCMENAFPKINETVPIIAEPVICDNWGEGK
ncbi:MAG: hypothetical protein EOM67_08215 [Spirochaetia bacterium]|nr:hypothetical protein [Spirochaetia bacterium]